jgi:hypothetical protein
MNRNPRLRSVFDHHEPGEEQPELLGTGFDTTIELEHVVGAEEMEGRHSSST